ncbi:molybdate ABC transporter substrate-binding protein [Methylosinus sporium]|uniref:molybdate ABC transporter substrate-binding protein n=1 Tax=Methylosinus sporium TaxID=428 RepID=UPI00383A5480
MSSKIKRLIVGGVSAVALMATTLSAQATTYINIASAANFSATLADIWNDFHAYYLTNYGLDYGYTVTTGPTATLKADIIAGSPQFDFFFSADQATPVDLYNNHRSLVDASPFEYAEGSLVLWSGPLNTVNISGGLPSPLTTNFVIAAPNAAPYGYAAMQVLNDAPWSLGLTTSTTYPSGYVYTATSIGNTYNAVLAGTYPYGFVAKSQVCRTVSGTPTWNSYSSTTYAREYYAEGTSSSNAVPPNPISSGSQPYDHITQYAIQIANSSRTTAQSTELTNFVNWLNGSTPGSTAHSVILSYCYRWAL